MGTGRPPSWIARRVESYLPGIYESIASDIRRVQAAHRAVLTSWYRSREENQRAYGAGSSQHLIGLAIDLVPPRGQWGATKEWLRRNRWGYVLDEGDHLHAQVFRDSPSLRRFVDWAAS